MRIPPGILQALPPYLGGKRRLAPLIFSLLHELIPQANWRGLIFLDPMCGGGAVALAAKALGLNVIAGDGSLRGAIVARALIANSTTRLAKHEIARLLIDTSPDETSGPREQDVISRLFSTAADHHEPLASLLRLVLVKAYLRSFPMSLPSATDARAFMSGDLDRISPSRLVTYMKGRELRTPAGLWHIARQINGGVIGGPGRAVRGDALEVIRSRSADVLYLDPPYAGTTGYSQTYQSLDRLLGDSVESQPPSLNDLLESASHIPVIILSYGGPGVSAESIAEIVLAHRHVVRSVDVPYAHLRSIATAKGKEKTREVIIIAER
ncbi:MAG: DNA adenine methylase [Planctomycetota bacterium]